MLDAAADGLSSRVKHRSAPKARRARPAERAEARDVIAHTARESGAASLAACAARFGRDAATLSHAGSRIERKSADDPAFAKHLKAINNGITQA
jgi:chromosomal replication initiation ATPase DnaA